MPADASVARTSSTIAVMPQTKATVLSGAAPAHAGPGLVLLRRAEHHPDPAALPGEVLAGVGEVGAVPLPVEERGAAEALAVGQHVLDEGADGGDARAGGEEE